MKRKKVLAERFLMGACFAVKWIFWQIAKSWVNKLISDVHQKISYRLHSLEPEGLGR